MSVTEKWLDRKSRQWANYGNTTSRIAMLLGAAVFIGFLLCFAVSSFAHGGADNKYGCHRDKKAGGSHCHHKELYKRLQKLEQRKVLQQTTCQEIRKRFMQYGDYNAKKMRAAKDAIAYGCWKLK